MNPQLSIAIAHSRQQDLRAAATGTHGAHSLSTGTSIIRRLREAAVAMWPKTTAPRPRTDSPLSV
jgi:hypothetical protein